MGFVENTGTTTRDMLITEKKSYEILAEIMLLALKADENSAKEISNAMIQLVEEYARKEISNLHEQLKWERNAAIDAEKKSVDEILSGQLSGMSVRIPTVLLKHVSKAMHEYAAQELAEYKKVIEELLPVAEQEIKMSTSIGYTYDKLKSIIERARKLIKL